MKIIELNKEMTSSCDEPLTFLSGLNFVLINNNKKFGSHWKNMDMDHFDTYKVFEVDLNI